MRCGPKKGQGPHAKKRMARFCASAVYTYVRSFISKRGFPPLLHLSVDNVVPLRWSNCWFVIGIIALLISILLPALSQKARPGRPPSTKCLANMEADDDGQPIMYSNDWKGSLPYNGWGRRARLSMGGGVGGFGFRGRDSYFKCPQLGHTMDTFPSCENSYG